jgi:hypothetical protein
MHLIKKLNYNASRSDYGCLFVEAPDFQVNSAKSHPGTLLAHFDFGSAEDDTECYPILQTGSIHTTVATS